MYEKRLGKKGEKNKSRKINLTKINFYYIMYIIFMEIVPATK